MSLVDIPKVNPECEIVNSRIFNFPQDLVFDAWQNPEHLKNWWGPKGFTNTFNEFDFRAGGMWKFVMHGPEAGHYNNEVEFIRIDKPSLIYWKRHSQPYFKILATFEKLSENETKLVFKMIFETAEECSKLRPHVEDKNEENFDRLEVELQRMTDARELLSKSDEQNEPFATFQEDIFENEGKHYVYYHNNGNVMYEGHYYSLSYNSAGQIVDEKFQGVQREYYENGNIMEEISYKDGVAVGMINYYDENGNLTESLPADLE